MNKSPLVSVILPTYNGAKYIKETLESVINQTHKNLEIIIIDDCSTDDTVKIITSFTDTRIKFYQNETNLGIAENTNKALNYATGEFIMMQDHDDISSPYRAEGILKILLEHKDVTGCGTDAYHLDTRHNKLVVNILDISEPVIAMDNEDIAITYLFDTIIFHPTIMYRASILKSMYKPYSSEFQVSSDSGFYIRLHNLGTKWYLLKNKYISYRTHSTNTSSLDPIRNYTEKKIIIREIIKHSLPFATETDIRNHSIIQARREILSYRGEANDWCHDWYKRIINYNLETNIYNHQKLLKTMAKYWKYFVTLSNILTPIKAIKLYHSIEELEPYLSKNTTILKDWQKRFLRAMKWKFIRNKSIKKGKK